MLDFISKVLSILLTGILTAVGFCIGQNLVDKYYERKERKNF